jgi:voltage-gated potassium channel
MILLVITSVFLLIYTVNHPTTKLIEAFENIAMIIFATEYFLRVWVSSDNHKIILKMYEERLLLDIPFSAKDAIFAVIKKKIAYMLTPLAIIDLLAILPSYRPLRVLRIFLLFRLFKLFRYSRNIQAFANVIVQKRFELGTLAIFAGFIVITSSAAIYIYEGSINPKIDSYFHAIYWSIVTISTVGFGDITPQTTEGIVITLVLILAGISVLAFLTSIVVSAFDEKLSEMRENRIFGEVEKMKDFVLVCGYGRVGEVVARFLNDDNDKFVVIDIDEKTIETAKSRGLKALKGDATQSKLLQDLGVGSRVSKVVCVSGSDKTNIFIAITARSLDKNVSIISRVEDRENRKKFLLAGANYVFTPYEIVGVVGLEYIKQPIAYEALSSMVTGEKGIEFNSVTVSKHSFTDKKRVDKIEFLKRKLLLFGVLRDTKDSFDVSYIKSYEVDSKKFYFNPTNNFILLEGDVMIVLGRKFHVDKFRKEVDLSAI